MTEQIETISDSRGMAELVAQIREQVGNFPLTIAVTGIDNPYATKMAKVISPYLHLGENASDNALAFFPDDMGSLSPRSPVQKRVGQLAELGFKLFARDRAYPVDILVVGANNQARLRRDIVGSQALSVIVGGNVVNHPQTTRQTLLLSEVGLSHLYRLYNPHATDQ